MQLLPLYNRARSVGTCLDHLRQKIEQLLSFRGREWFENAHLGGASCLHALNAAEAHAIRAYGLSNPICIVPNGVDLPKATSAGRPAWAGGAGEDRKILLFLGRLHPKKGLVNLIAAWRDVRPAPGARDWMLVIAGWDQDGHGQGDK